MLLPLYCTSIVAIFALALLTSCTGIFAIIMLPCLVTLLCWVALSFFHHASWLLRGAALFVFVVPALSPMSCWPCHRHCVCVVALFALVSLPSSCYIAFSILSCSATLLFSHHAGWLLSIAVLFAIIVWALLPLVNWHLSCHCTSIVALVMIIYLLLLHWHCYPHCIGIVVIVALASLLSSGWHLCRCWLALLTLLPWRCWCHCALCWCHCLCLAGVFGRLLR
jgi:hypothetical protein